LLHFSLSNGPSGGSTTHACRRHNACVPLFCTMILSKHLTYLHLVFPSFGMFLGPPFGGPKYKFGWRGGGHVIEKKKCHWICAYTKYKVSLEQMILEYSLDKTSIQIKNYYESRNLLLMTYVNDVATIGYMWRPCRSKYLWGTTRR
jgi:hypothetical protein